MTTNQKNNGVLLANKLGLRPGQIHTVLNEPSNYQDLLPGFYASMGRNLDSHVNWMHAFYRNQKDLESEFPTLKAHLSKDGQLWVSWPKKASEVKSDLNDNVVRDIGLANGLVDVKVTAIDETWSAIKFVYRLKDRS